MLFGCFGQRALLAMVCAGPCLLASDSRLIEAVKEQDRKAITSLLSQHVDVNAAQPDGATPLAWAVYLNQKDTVDLLMKAGAKANTVDEYGESPLTLAAITGDAGVIEKLLKAGADAGAARWNGETALMLAARSGNLDAVKLLLEHGAKVNAADSRKGQNALMWAAAEGHSGVVEFLLAHGADVKAVSQGGFTPLVFAAQKGDAKSVASLLQAGLDPNYTLPGGASVLEMAVRGSKTEAAEALLDSGAKPDLADASGYTALHFAAQAGNLKLVQHLLAKHANPNLRTAKINAGERGNFFRGPSGEQTPLLLAARANHKDVMEALVKAGADPAVKAQDGGTLLMAAAGSGHVEVVQYAYELAPDVKAVTDRKSTVMHAAVTGSMQNSTQPEVCKVIRFLAEKGADLDDVDARGRTPLAIADFLPIDQAVELLTKLIEQSGATPKARSKR